MKPVMLCLLLLLAVAPCRAWTRVETPPAASLEWVAEDMVYNGVPMRIQFFRSKVAPGEVLAHYRQRWSDGARRQYVENRLGPWKVISRAVGAFFITVQVRPASGGGAEGYLAQRPLAAKARPVLGQGVALPPGSEVVNDILSRDAHRPARTLLAFNGLSTDANAAFFRERYAREGWTIASDAKGQGGVRQMVLQRDGEEMSLALSFRNGKTALGATLVAR